MPPSDAQRAAARRHYEANKSAYKARAIAHNLKQRARLRALITEAKCVPCLDCGVEYHPCVMDFDHVLGEKTRNVSDMVNAAVSEATLFAEIAKCEVVCSNCHRLRTLARR